MSKLTAPLSALVVAALLVGCTPHRVEVRQGNYLTQEVIDQLEVGMTRDQVRYLLGTPVVASPFHANRWDYVYSRKRHRAEDEYAYLVVWFDANNTVERVDVKTEPPSA